MYYIRIIHTSYMEMVPVNRNALKISDMEAEIMKIVWAKDAPITYKEIRSTVNQRFDMGSQSIQTMLKRLVEKGVLTQEKQDVYYYSALVVEADYIKAKTMSLVEKVFDGNVKGLLSALIRYDTVTTDDLQELQQFWQEGKDKHE